MAIGVLRGKVHDVLELWKEARLIHEVGDVAVYLNARGMAAPASVQTQDRCQIGAGVDGCEWK